MAHRTGHDRRQFRFPDPLEDMIAPDNMVRVVDAFVDAIDLEKLGFVRVRAHKRGAPPCCSKSTSMATSIACAPRAGSSWSAGETSN